MVFYGALDPHTPVGQGWLRASHRKLDAKRSEPYRPYHSHDEVWPLTPGEKVELDVEIWPTCIVVPKGYRIGLTVRGKDYEWAGVAATLSNMKNPMKGCGPFVHDDPQDRPPEVFHGTNTLHFAPGDEPYLLLAGDPGVRSSAPPLSLSRLRGRVREGAMGTISLCNRVQTTKAPSPALPRKRERECNRKGAGQTKTPPAEGHIGGNNAHPDHRHEGLDQGLGASRACRHASHGCGLSNAPDHHH